MINIGIGVYYHVNKEYISKQLCENRNNPQMHCNGHCYLSKQLKKAEEGEKQSSQIIKEKEEIIANRFQALSATYFPSYSVQLFIQFNSALYISDGTHLLIKPPAA